MKRRDGWPYSMPGDPKRRDWRPYLVKHGILTEKEVEALDEVLMQELSPRDLIRLMREVDRMLVVFRSEITTAVDAVEAMESIEKFIAGNPLLSALRTRVRGERPYLRRNRKEPR